MMAVVKLALRNKDLLVELTEPQKPANVVGKFVSVTPSKGELGDRIVVRYSPPSFGAGCVIEPEFRTPHTLRTP